MAPRDEDPAIRQPGRVCATGWPGRRTQVRSRPEVSARATAAPTRVYRLQRGGSSPAPPADRSLSARTVLRTAQRCSRSELLALAGVGRKVVGEVETWLSSHGERFRSDPLPAEHALARALGLVEALVERGDDAALLAAFVAPPELRRSLETPASRTYTGSRASAPEIRRCRARPAGTGGTRRRPAHRCP